MPRRFCRNFFPAISLYEIKCFYNERKPYEDELVVTISSSCDECVKVKSTKRQKSPACVPFSQSIERSPLSIVLVIWETRTNANAYVNPGIRRKSKYFRAKGSMNQDETKWNSCWRCVSQLVRSFIDCILTEFQPLFEAIHKQATWNRKISTKNTFWTKKKTFSKIGARLQWPISSPPTYGYERERERDWERISNDSFRWFNTKCWSVGPQCAMSPCALRASGK